MGQPAKADYSCSVSDLEMWVQFTQREPFITALRSVKAILKHGKNFKALMRADGSIDVQEVEATPRRRRL